MSSVASDNALAEAVRLYGSGNLAKAEAICRAVLVAEPGHSTALVLGGELAVALGDSTTARERLIRAADMSIQDERILKPLAKGLCELREFAIADRVLQTLLTHLPQDFDALLIRGQVQEALGQSDEALASYEQAIVQRPGHAGPETRRAVLLLRRAWGEPLASPAAKSQKLGAIGRITMTPLGWDGRFGNQLLQYGFLRAVGSALALKVEVPEWIGRWLFDLDDPFCGSVLPQIREQGEMLAQSLLGKNRSLLADRDVWGYCQYPTRYLRPHQSLIRILYQPGEKLRAMVDPALARLRERGRTIVAIHLRRGDFKGGPNFWPAPTDWYLNWLNDVWHTLDRPVLYVASDEPAIEREFSMFAPLTCWDIGAPVEGAEMYPDFYILAHADLLAIANSSFSFAASLLNTNAREFHRPDPRLGRLVPFNPWDVESISLPL